MHANQVCLFLLVCVQTLSTHFFNSLILKCITGIVQMDFQTIRRVLMFVVGEEHVASFTCYLASVGLCLHWLYLVLYVVSWYLKFKVLSFLTLFTPQHIEFPWCHYFPNNKLQYTFIYFRISCYIYFYEALCKVFLSIFPFVKHTPDASSWWHLCPNRSASWLPRHHFVSAWPIREENGHPWWFFIGEIVCFCGKPSADCCCHTMWYIEMATATVSSPCFFWVAFTCLS